MVRPVPALIEAPAITVPTKVELVASVAESPICQYTLHGWAPLISSTLVAEPVVRELPTWKMKTALGSPWALSVTAPAEKRSDEEAVYTPGVKVWPERSVPAEAVEARPDASVMPATRSF